MKNNNHIKGNCQRSISSILIPLVFLFAISSSPLFAHIPTHAPTNNENASVGTFHTNDTIIKGEIIHYPQFPGGKQEMVKYMQTHTIYPKKALHEGIGGRVIVHFVVLKDGRIINLKIIKGVEPSLDEEAKRVISSMPLWEPGKANGIPVNFGMTVPVYFRNKNVKKNSSEVNDSKSEKTNTINPSQSISPDKKN